MCPKFLFIRHSKKLFNNGKPINNLPKHDPPLIAGQEEDMIKKLYCLKAKYGIPNHIYTSPYLRTRQTTQVITEFFNGISVSFDYNLKEFLGWQKPKSSPADLDAITNAYLVNEGKKELIGVEKPKDVEERVLSFLRNFEENDNNFYYVITHGIVISKLCKIIENKECNFEDFCGVYVVMENKTIEYI